MFKEAIHRKVNNALLIVLAFLLPFSMHQTVRFTGITMIILAANMLLSKQWLKLRFNQLNRYTIASMGLFLLTLIGYFFSENIKSAGQLLETRVILLVLPLVYGIMGMPLNVVVQKMFWALYTGIIVSSLLIFRQGLAPFTNVLNEGGSIYWVLELLIPMHRPYYGMLMVCVIAFSLSQFTKLNLWQKLLVLLLNLYLITLIGFMVPKMVVFSSVIAFFVLVIRYLYDGLSGFKKVLAMAGLLGIVLGVGVSVNTIVGAQEENSNTLQTSIVSRKQLWQSAYIELQNPITFFFGVGLGDEADTLLAHFTDSKTGTDMKKLNVHNQYLAEWLKFGILGLLVALFIGIYPTYLAWQEGQLLVLFVGIIWMLNLLTENYLNREAGLLTLMMVVFPLVGLQKQKAVSNQFFGNFTH